MNANRKRAGCSATVLAAVLVSGCTFNPMVTSPSPASPPPAVQPQAGPMTSASLPPGLQGTPSNAEEACIAAGRERGLNVLGVVGSRTADDLSRDVILRVQRSGSVLEVRCNYVTSTQTARVMLI